MKTKPAQLFLVTPSPNQPEVESEIYTVVKMEINEITSSEPDSRPEHESFLQRYFLYLTTILYYVGSLPFRFRAQTLPLTAKALKTGFGMKLERNKLQKGICLATHSMMLYSTCYMTYFNLYGMPVVGRKTITFREAILVILGPTLCLYYGHTAWWHFNWFTWLLDQHSHIIKKTVKPYSTFEIFQNYGSFIGTTVSLVGSFYSHLWQGNSIFYNTNWYEEGTFYEVEGLLLYWVTSYTYIFLFHMGSIMLHGVALSFRDMAREFISMMEMELEEEEGKFEFGGGSHVIERFFELEAFVNGLNARFGGWILISIIFTVPYYSKKIVELVKGEATSVNNFLTLWYTFSIMFWLLSTANVSNRICDVMRNWLMRNGNYARLTTQQLTMLTPKVTPDGIALRGANFLAVSYPLIGTVVSIGISWAFIDQNN